MFPSSPPKQNLSLPLRSLSLQTLKGDFEPVGEVSGPFYVFEGGGGNITGEIRRNHIYAQRTIKEKH